MRIALAQLNPIVGDVAGNTRMVKQAMTDAIAQGADLVVTPELLVSGYPPKDLLLREGFVAACDQAVGQLAQQIDPRVGLLIGHPSTRNVPPGQCANAVSLLCGGQVVATRHKYLLPN